MIRTYNNDVLETVNCLCGDTPASHVTTPLLRWYAECKRDLPWRGITNPYHIWVSEIIMQQTQVSQGWNYYLRFIERFPTVQDLADAPLDAVLKIWEGLGYYSRARNLHEAAKTVVNTFGGKIPSTYSELLTLKGVGAYTASAIASMAYQIPTAAVDGNALRVASRYWGISQPVNSPQTARLITALLDRLIENVPPGEFNQAIMDLGATICKPQSPSCADCPLRSACTAHRMGNAHLLPVKEKKLVRHDRRLMFVYVMRGDRMLIRRREGRDIWRGLYEPLCIENPYALGITEISNDILSDLMATRNAIVGEIELGVRHMLTHLTVIADFYSLILPPETIIPASVDAAGYKWVHRDEWEKYAFPVIVRLEKLLCI